MNRRFCVDKDLRSRNKWTVFFFLQLSIINPRRDVMEKMILSKFTSRNGKGMFFLTVDEAVEACRFSLHESRQKKDESTAVAEV